MSTIWKSYSATGSVFATWKLCCMQPKRFFAFLWPMVLTIALATGALFCVLSSWCEWHVETNAPLLALGANPSLDALWQRDFPIALAIVGALFIAVLWSIARFAAHAYLVEQIESRLLEDELLQDRCTTFWLRAANRYKHMVGYDLVWQGITTVLAIITFVIAYYTIWWVLLVLPMLYFFLSIVEKVGRLHLAVLKTEKRVAMTSTLHVVRTQWAKLFVVRMITFLLEVVVLCIAATPLLPLLFSIDADVHSNLVYGMASGIPTMAMAIECVLLIPATAMVCMAWVLAQWPLALITVKREPSN